MTHCTTSLPINSRPESHGQIEFLSCPSDLDAIAPTQGAVSNYPCVSQESLEETEPHSKSLIVSRNVVYSLPDRRATSLNLPSNQVSSTGSQTAGISEQQGSILNLIPPFFLSKKTRATSRPQESSVQCSQTESIKPSQDTIATLQDNLHRTNNDTKVDPSESTISNPAARHSWASNEQPCPPSPLNKIRSTYLVRQPSQTSQGSTSTVKANSSGSNSPAETPHSSPLLNTHRGHAGGNMCCQPTQCTEASLNEHRATSEDWQTHSIKSHIQGTSYIVSGSSGEYQDRQLSSRSGRLITSINIIIICTLCKITYIRILLLYYYLTGYSQ